MPRVRLGWSLVDTGLQALRRRDRRFFWWSFAVLVALLAATALAPSFLRGPDDDAWVRAAESRGSARLDAAAAEAGNRLEALARFAAAAAAGCPVDSLPLKDPFALCSTWTETWRRDFGGDGPDSLAVALWAGGQRLGWAGPVIPGSEEPFASDQRLLHDDHWWVLREVALLPGSTNVGLECQLRLAAVEHRGGAAGGVARSVQRTVVLDTRVPSRRIWGDAQRGLRLVEDVVLGPGEPRTERPRLRLTVQIPPRSLQTDRSLAAVAMARGFLVGLAALALGAALAGWVGFWLAAWLVRGFWAQTDLFRWLAAAIPADRLPAAPQQPASLLDPAYFATTFAGGWFASGADALLTAVLGAGTVAWLWSRRPVAAAPAGEGRRQARFALVLPVAAAAVFGLHRLWRELAENANARLIGLEVPLEAWTFWALHAVILMLSLSVLTGLVVLAARLGGGLPARLTGTARPFWLAGGLLVTVLFNYSVLSGVYGEAERDWLHRKAEEIVQPQDDWISFLIEDVLGELVGEDTAGLDPAEVGGGRGSLRADLPAYRLWRRSAIADLGLPCLVEVLDADGRTTSLYATGFLRDFGYEIVERGDWWSLAEAGEEGGGRIGVLLQDEVRRYPTGRERILRGEIAREGGRGWLRLELPVQSLRITTLSSRLAGAQDVGTGGGYRPRLEVDRPLRLLRGDSQRWLDAGFGELPDAAGERAIAELRAGTRDWAVIDLDRSEWLCRWAPLPGDSGGGEGFLLGLQRRGAVEVLLDVGRLLLLDVALLAIWSGAWILIRRRWRWLPGFQGRFLLGYLAIGVVLLVVAGGLADRQTFQSIDREARDRARDGLVTTLGQLRGLLAEQARSLAASDYLSELLAGNLPSERPLGPLAARQGIVFGPADELLLDETLSDLDHGEVRELLQAAREGPLVVMDEPDGLYLGVLIPIDLGGVLAEPLAVGTFFYRQLVDDQLLPGLADVVGAEITLRVDGEVFDASHPGRVFSGESQLLELPDLMAWFRAHPLQARLRPRAAGLGFTAGMALPSLSFGPDGRLARRALPAVLAVDFPDRERDYTAQRRRMALFLAGLITLLLLTAFGLAMVLTWNIFEPLRVLLGATRRLAAGDFQAPLPPAGGDEVGRLSAGFQIMRDRLGEAQAVLEARERFLQAVLDQVPVGVLVWDAEGRLAVANPAANQILARFYRGQASGADAAAWSDDFRNDVAAQLPPGGGELSSGDGRRTLRVALAPLALGAERPHELVVCEDLTQFLAAKKLALNAELARQVAHEIKNPLTPIQLSVQLLQQAFADRHPRLDAIVADAVQRILEQVRLLRSIASEFSLLGRPGEFPCEPLDLPSLVRDVAAGYRSGEVAGGPRVAIADTRVPPVLAHRESLLKVLGNLMQNSLDAVGAPDGLVVDVTWRLEPTAVSLVWADNGPGIAPDVAGRLFNPYFSTKSKGTGLGLAICRNLLDKMGGSMTLTNRDGARGAMAVITLPRADAAKTPAGGDLPQE
ncbi:MAG TPA: ATP-binding protein [Candidatus Krumholzibacteria bacterium]|nr:ATP-binding protein [Candidatus Krumholzibacteria bacterium]HPD72336.1 ATP-binding protein [Candidatus Krumholzibacteria bacterium]HRY40732.1 ATP-binding protein [Candidatus Krumholzibacteria bacterium]